MADSRLTDLPNLTTPNSDDVLYIVDVTRDSSNKITYANLVTNTINSLSAYLNSIDIPSINGLVTDVATLSVTQLTKANQADLNATNNSLNTLESNVAVYAGYITKNTGDIVALSGYIDTKALNSDLNATNTRVDEISGTLSTKASQNEVDSKASQGDFDNLSTSVNVVSGVVINQESNISNLFDITNTNTATIAFLNNDHVPVSAFNDATNTLSGNIILVDSRVTELSADTIDTDFEVRPFNISLTTQSHFLTTFYGITAPRASGNDIPLTSINTVASLSSNTTSYLGWGGLLTNVYLISSGACQISIFNPTASTVSFTDTDLHLLFIG